MESANVKVDEKNISQIGIYEQELTVEMIITKLVTPLPKYNVELVTLIVSENSTVTEEQERGT